ncbi:iron uptake system protein EfeO [Nocardioides panaciterrulae]|uniref:Iron uptake system component EfeO n=1 Tax=Nocardioides panaciterrulae TaxID=661492 RepID=A0A7Y9E7N0_9ACTN|nr:iron uptake system protein EfeO [Nocardioides panaciterrulae]NYD42507.1 iron uptake system component EfeO [Nocardioides panaciterrulae]
MRLPLPLLAATLVALPALAACTQNAASETTGSSGDGTVTVSSTDDACRLSSTEAPSGRLTFEVTNDGSQVTEFYLLDQDGKRIVGEVENIGPQLTRQLVVQAAPGTYTTACKPGMKGDGIRADFTVTDSGTKVETSADEQAMVEEAQEDYRAWVQQQSDLLVQRTRAFVEAYEAGDDRTAKALYPRARTPWERIETVAESFGDLDPRMDAREVDLEPGQEWTGWHRLEKDLWPARAEKYASLTQQQRKQYAEGLLANTVDLDKRIGGLTFTVDQIANGSRGLLEEVAKSKVSGEEEYWSRTDLYDFQANVDGARKALDVLTPLLRARDPQLLTTLQHRFDALQQLLDAQRSGDGFRSYDQLSQQQVHRLADAVNAVAEPLSRLTAAVIS